MVYPCILNPGQSGQRGQWIYLAFGGFPAGGLHVVLLFWAEIGLVKK